MDAADTSSSIEYRRPFLIQRLADITNIPEDDLDTLSTETLSTYFEKAAAAEGTAEDVSILDTIPYYLAGLAIGLFAAGIFWSAAPVALQPYAAIIFLAVGAVGLGIGHLSQEAKGNKEKNKIANEIYDEIVVNVP
jgi:hypothetical protein